MVAEDYVGFEVAKLLKEKGFDGICGTAYETITNEHAVEQSSISEWGKLGQVKRPTHQMARRWLLKTHSILLIVDYDYECTDKSYCYKIYKLGENGKPERVTVEGVRYDRLGEPHVDVVAYRDYKRSFFDYETYEEACEAGIRYCLENLMP